jgi:hypothetical protein
MPVAGLAHLRGLVLQRSCGSEGWEFGGALAGLRSRPKDWRSHSLWSRGSAGLWGGAWHAALAVLLVNRMEKTSTS